MAIGISSSTPASSFNPTSSASKPDMGGMGGELAMDVLKLVGDMMSLAGGKSAGGPSAPGASSGASGATDPGATDSSSAAGATDSTDPTGATDPSQASADGADGADSQNPLKGLLEAFSKITGALSELMKSLGSLFGGGQSPAGGTNDQPSGLNPLNPAQDASAAQPEQSPISF